MSGEETREKRRPCSLACLEEDIHSAQELMREAGFNVADHATPYVMVDWLLRRNADQKKLEDGLRERLKAAEKERGQWKQRALAAERWIKRKGWITGDVYEANTERGVECPFHITVGGCNARRSEENGDWCRCAHEPRNPDFPDHYPDRPPCRLDEGPLLVKKAEAAAPGDDFVGISKAVLGYVKGLKAEEDSGDSLTDAIRRADNIIGRALIEAVRNYEPPTGKAEEDSGSDTDNAKDA